MRILRVSSVWALTFGLSILIHPAHAKIVPIAITAEVTSISDGTGTGLLESRINVGDTITGVYIYDSSSPDSYPDPLYRRGL